MSAERLNWDEFRIVKAIAETHSLAGAAERLGLNHSTMFRRLTALEARLGMRLFERGRAGYQPTAAGADMVSLATLMGDTIAEFERRVSQDEVKLSGLVRLVSLNSLGALVLPGPCLALRARHPDLQVELILTDATFDLFGGEADLALRCTKEPPAEPLTGRRIATLPWAIFAVEALIAPSGELAAGAPWVFPIETFGPPAARRWLERNVERRQRAAIAGNDIVMAELAARGVGAALLPYYVGEARPELRRVGAADPDLDCELWLVAHPQSLSAPRVRAVFDFLSLELEKRWPRIEGEATPES
ncbi:MAG: LysR family transcriptional regulator [Pseudomonadota bacterium]|nr:LysR family transcriptional regulator [Pseudomonadota bacterium]